MLSGLCACSSGGTSQSGAGKGGLNTAVHNDDLRTAEKDQLILQRNPDDAATRFDLAKILEAHGDNLQAEVQYRILAENDKDNAGLHRDLGRVLLRQGKASEAKGEYEKALGIDSDDVKAMNGLGISLDYLGNHAAAQKMYKDALDDNASDVPSLNNLAHSYVLSGNYKEAISLLEPHLNDKTATPELRQNLAEAYGMAGMDVDAERVGRIDLSVEQVKHNLAYYHSRREQLSIAPKFYADLGSFPTEAMAESRVEQIKSLFAKETETVVINVAPEVKAVGGTPAFGVKALGFTSAAKARIFCDKLAKQSIACTAHG